MAAAWLLSFASLCAGAEISDTRTRSEDPYIRTIQTRVGGNDQLIPVITTESADGLLEISFDELADDYRQLRYEIIHCDSRWRPTQGITSQEYIEAAFNQADIENYDYSMPGLSTRYVHYSIPFPMDGMRPAMSGNYILRVFPYDNHEKTLLVSRFMVSEQSASVSAQVNTVTDIDYNESHQQLSFTVDTRNTPVEIADPFSRLTAVIYQNSRTDNAVVLDHPSRVEGRDKVVYEHLRPLIFDAGNEYRRFETVATNYTPLRIESMDYKYPYYHFWVEKDYPRAAEPYYYDSTQRGRFRIRNANASSDSDLESEYVVTHFTLEMPPLPEGVNVYIDGDLTYHTADPASKMQYDYESGAYTRALLLKQGSYNYQYLVGREKPEGKQAPLDAGYVEGNKYETANEYLICIYYSAPGERYQRLLSVNPVIIR